MWGRTRIIRHRHRLSYLFLTLRYTNICTADVSGRPMTEFSNKWPQATLGRLAASRGTPGTRRPFGGVRYPTHRAVPPMSRHPSNQAPGRASSAHGAMHVPNDSGKQRAGSRPRGPFGGPCKQPAAGLRAAGAGGNGGTGEVARLACARRLARRRVLEAGPGPARPREVTRAPPPPGSCRIGGHGKQARRASGGNAPTKFGR